MIVMKKIQFICVLVLFFSLPGSAQIFNTYELSNCIIKNCNEDSLFRKNKFKKVYDGPMKQGGFISLFHNKSKREYIFTFSNENFSIKQFIYYLPKKSTYNNFLKNKNAHEDINIEGLGRVWYDDGKLYYQISILKKEN